MRRTHDRFRSQTSRNKRVRKLNMRFVDDFKWNLSKILEEVPDENVAAVKGAIYAKASKIGIKEAKQFIREKEDEGIFSSNVAKKLTSLLTRYSTYR